MKSELPKFSDCPVEIFHSLLRQNTEKHLEAKQIIREARYINHLRLDDEKFKENFIKTSAWATYQYITKEISILIRKYACFLLDYFSEIYTHINYNKIPFIVLLIDLLSTKGKRKQKENTFSIPVLKLVKAKHSHLPIGFNCLNLPSLKKFCDSSNCFFNNIVITQYTARILACRHVYHNECFSKNEYKCLYCLKFLQDNIDEQVQLLLERFQRNNTNNIISEEFDDIIPEEEDDDIKETADNITIAWDLIVRKFLSQ